jgi:hypothetical protein
LLQVAALALKELQELPMVAAEEQAVFKHQQDFLHQVLMQ